MAYKISWSDIALEDYHNILEYLIAEWSLSVAANFEKFVNRKLANLSKQPFTGIKSEKNPIVRSILFTPHNRLYYRITQIVLNCSQSLIQGEILKKILSEIRNL